MQPSLLKMTTSKYRRIGGRGLIWSRSQFKSENQYLIEDSNLGWCLQTTSRIEETQTIEVKLYVATVVTKDIMLLNARNPRSSVMSVGKKVT